MGRWPPLLAPGARVALVSPAAGISKEDLTRADANARSFGWEPVVGRYAGRRHHYLAGTDQERLADLQWALDDPTVDAVWCMRGGYGAMRLLDHLSFDAVHRQPKTIMGFSDITALLLALGQRASLIGYHAPMARMLLTPFTRTSLLQAVVDGRNSAGRVPNGRTFRGGQASGRLVGGSLTMLSALCGTPYAMDANDAIVFLEDVGEPPYRIDRMVQQLLMSGALSGCRGIALGVFTELPGGDADRSVIDEIFTEVAGALGVPCFAGIPIGHIDDQWTLPVGAEAILDASAHTLMITSSRS